MLNNEQAAALLGVKVKEIAAVADSPAGVVITTTDDVGYLLVDKRNPDAEGKTGLMLLAAPTEQSVAVLDGCTQWNGFPVFVSEDLVDDEPAAGEPAAAKPKRGKKPPAPTVDDLDSKTLDELLAIAEPLAVKPKGRSMAAKHASLVAGITAKRDELAAAPAGDGDALLAVVAELDELTDDELADRAKQAGVDVAAIGNRDDLITAIAAVSLANQGA